MTYIYSIIVFLRYHHYRSGSTGRSFAHGVAHGAGAAIGWRLVSLIGLPIVIGIVILAFIVYKIRQRRRTY